LLRSKFLQESHIVEKKGTVELSETDIEKLGDLITQYRKIALQKDALPPSIFSTTEDTILLKWYRDGSNSRFGNFRF
jgi:hypothetical protein